MPHLAGEPGGLPLRRRCTILAMVITTAKIDTLARVERRERR